MKGTSKLVLIVDDDEELCEVLDFACKEMKIPAHVARTVEQAKQWLDSNRPSLVILDIMLPGGNGLDFCRWIRQQPALDEVPVIVSSGLKDEETTQDALELG